MTTSAPPQPSRAVRALAIVALFVIAPITAELLQAYLSDGSATQLAVVLFLGPLYGGAALAIRELVIGTGRSGIGLVLLAGAFGLAMTGLIDLSAFTPARADVAGWDLQWDPTAVAGFSPGAVLTWVIGHVVFSIATPILLVDGLLPGVHRRRLLPWQLLVLLLVPGVLVAWWVRQDSTLVAVISAPGQLTCAAGVLALVVAALSPLGRRRWPALLSRPRTPVGVAGCALVLLVAQDLLAFGWPSTVARLALVLIALVLLGCAARAPWWTLRHGTAVAVVALVERTAIGFLAPLPPGMTVTAKVVQSVVLGVLVLIVASVASWRTWRADSCKDDDRDPDQA